ncbi:MAG: PD-(D/E)XK nuclease family protein [Bacillota bacterium]|nr:PD-(D/E)XK nuclease family protein [Bacillota bacterium]
MLQVWCSVAGEGGRCRLLAELRAQMAEGRGEEWLYVAATPALHRELERRLWAGPGLFGCGESRLYLMDGLAEKLLSEEGYARSEVGASAREVALERILLRLKAGGRLYYLSPIAHLPGVARALGALISEWKRAGIDPQRWEKALRDLAGSAGVGQHWRSPAVQARLADLAAIYREYARCLEERGLWEKEDRLNYLVGRLRRGGFRSLAGVRRVVLDGFYDFTPAQSALLGALEEAGLEVVLNLPLRGEEARRYEPLRRSLAGLEVRWEEVARPPGGEPGQPEVAVLRAADPQAEARAISLRIKALLLDGKVEGPEEVAVVAREEAERQRIAQALRAAGIPCALDVETPLTALPLVAGSLEALREEAGSRWEKATPVEWAARLEERLNRLPLPPLTAGSAALRELLARERLREVLRQVVQGFALAGEEEEALPLAQFLAAVQRGAARQRVLLRPGDRGGVRVLEPGEVRGLGLAAVFLSGMREGNYPRHFHPDWLLSDSERRELRRAGLLLEDEAERRQKEELLLRHLAEQARRWLFLSYPGRDEQGQPVLPSLYLWELGGRAEPEPEPPQAEEWPLNARELRAFALAGWWKTGAEAAPPGLFSLLLRKEGESLSALLWRIKADEERWGSSYGPYDGLLSRPEAKERLRAAFGPGRCFTPTQLDGFVRCPFGFFCREVLGLEPAEEEGEEAAPADLGYLYHRILARFLRPYCGRPLNPEAWQEYRAALQEAIEQECRQYEEEAKGRGRALSGGFWSLQKRRLVRTLERWLRCELEAARSSPWYPAYLEIAFGLPPGPEGDPRSQPEPLHLKAGGEEVVVRGRIDRIDLDGRGNCAVYDYKSGSTPTYGELRAGRDLQLPLYLLAVERVLLPGRAAGGSYYRLGRECRRSPGLWREESGRPGGGRRKDGVVGEREWEELLARVEEQALECVRLIRGGEFRVRPGRSAEQCRGRCPYRPVCRYDRWRLAEKEEGASTGRGAESGREGEG